MIECGNCFYAKAESTAFPCNTCNMYDKYLSISSFQDQPVHWDRADEIDSATYAVKMHPWLNAGIGNNTLSIKPEGKKYDSGKPDWSLLPFKSVSETVDVLTFGANKYGPENWRLVPNAKKRYLAAAFRHIVAYATGEKKDSESGLSHLSHALCCLLFILELEKSDDTSNP